MRDSGDPWTFRFPSLLPPLAVAACGACLLAGAWVLAGSGGIRVRRALWVAVAGSVGIAVLGIATPVLGQVADAVTGWLLHRDPWIDGIQEFAPMLRASKYGVSPWTAWHQEFGWGGFFFPVAFLVVAVRLGRRPRAATLLYATLVATLLALVSNRYSRVAIPLMASCNGIAVAIVFRKLWGRRRAGRVPIWAPLAIVLASGIDLPTLGLLVPPRPKVQPIVDVAIQLRDHPPHPSLARGVLSNWTYGHQLEVLAGLPVVVNGFGSYLDPPRFWEAVEIFKGSGAALDRYMRTNQLGVLVAGVATIGQEVTGADESVGFAGGALNKVYMQSLPLSPLLIAGSAIPGWDVPHLPHLMPRYASSAVVSGIGFKLPYLWSYERVEGARLRGTAAPGSRVQAELPFTEHRRAHVYKAFTEAGADGYWELVVPFPSGMRNSAIRSDPEWTASAGGAAVRFRVSEDDVRGGGSSTSVPCPSLPRAARATPATTGRRAPSSGRDRSGGGPAEALADLGGLGGQVAGRDLHEAPVERACRLGAFPCLDRPGQVVEGRPVSRIGHRWPAARAARPWRRPRRAPPGSRAGPRLRCATGRLRPRPSRRGARPPGRRHRGGRCPG